MNGEFKMTIGRAVREIAQYYSSEESFAIKTGKHLRIGLITRPPFIAPADGLLFFFVI